ncbi:MAG TPA: four helix bundle protein, partial [bacterium]
MVEGMMEVIKSSRDLEVYKLALNEARNIFLISRKFPKEEAYSLTNQMRRSSRSVNALIAESWARRRYKAAFVNKINEAPG